MILQWLLGLWGSVASGSPPYVPSAYDNLLIAHGAGAHWKFDDGQALDLSFPLTDYISGLNGVASAGATNLIKQPGCLADGDTAAFVDGGHANQIYAVPDGTALHLTGPASYDCWFKIPTGTSGLSRTLSSTNSVFNGFSGRFNGSQLHATFNLGGSSVAANYSGTQPAFDVWHYLVGVWDGTNVILYLDGLSVASTPGSGTLNMGTTGLTFGGLSNGTSLWLGGMDEAAVYGRALTAAEVLAQYNLALNGAFQPIWAVNSNRTLGLNVEPQ